MCIHASKLVPHAARERGGRAKALLPIWRAKRPRAQPSSFRLISLQKGIGEEQIAQVPFGDRIERLGPDFDAGPDAFVDTAAAMMCLDFVISTGHSDSASGRCSRPSSLGIAKGRG